MQDGRNRFEHEGWVLEPLVDLRETRGFDCGKADLNNYFHYDIFPSERLRLTRTFKLYPIPEPDEDDITPGSVGIVGLVSFSNDALDFRIEGQLPHIPRGYRGGKLPAVKICRLAVSKDYQRDGVGSHLINIMKTMFCTDNRTGCRLVTVDAYNDEVTTYFYMKNGFEFLTASDASNKTRSMCFDLYNLRICQPRPK